MSSMKLVNLARTVKDRTESGRIVWEETGSKDEFDTSFSTYTIRVRKVAIAGSVSSRYGILILDDSGDLIEIASNSQLEKIQPGAGKELEKLFDAARRQAKGVDVAIDTILKELNRI